MDGELTYFSRLAGLLYSNVAGVAALEDSSEGRLQLETLRVRQTIVGRMGAFRAAEDGRLYICRVIAGITAIIDLADEAVLTGTAAALRKRMTSAAM